MKMVSNYGSNSNRKHNQVQLASLACGLALAAVAIVGGREVLEDGGNTADVPITRAVQPVSSTDPMDPTSLGIGQPGEGVKPVEATLIDPTDFGSLGIESALWPQFGTAADAVFAVESARQQVPPLTGITREAYFGLGQPGEGVQPVEATLIDPTDFGSLGIESALRPQFATAADAVFAVEGMSRQPALPPFFSTMVDGVYVIESYLYLV